MRKWTLNVGFELDQISNFMLLLLCYVNTRDKVVPKQLILAPRLVHIPTQCLPSSIFTFHVSFSLLNFTQFTCIDTANSIIAKMANMIDLDSYRKLSYHSNFETRSLNVLELMESIFGPPPINPANIEDSVINENWPRFNVISDVNFTVNSPLVPCILSGVNVKPMGVLKLFCDHPILTWNHVKIIPSRPLTGITKGPQYAVTRSFIDSIQADMNFSHCFPYCFLNQIVTSCMGLLIKGPWFTYAHTEIGGGASFALLNTGINIWCASISSTGTRFFERCCHSPEGFIEIMQRGPRERESRYLQFTLQRPGDLIYIPHLLAHDVLTLDTGSLTILSGWDAATTTNQHIIIQTLDEYTFGVRRGKWREIFRKEDLVPLREWVFSPATGPQESKNKLVKHWQ